VDRTGQGRARRLAAAAAVIGCTVPLAGCDLFGSGITLAKMTVSSGAFVQDVMPQRYTCAAGKAISPPLEWSGAPPGTKSFALVVDDSNTPITPYVYWIVFDISPAASGILQGQLPPGTRQAQNSAGKAAYDPPCPGAQSHGYRFAIYALDKTIDLPNGAPLSKAWPAIAAATIGWDRLQVNATS
jgi:Raf kinase inhibitor-like YbhB/YbcL family protein